MNYFRQILICCGLVVASLAVFPQNKELNTKSEKNVEFVKENFEKAHRGKLKDALSAIKDGDKYFEQGRKGYKKALAYYLKANRFNPNNAKLNYKIGICFLMGTIYKLKSISYFEKAQLLDPNVDSEFHYYLGQSYQINSEWDKAIAAYNEFIKSNPESPKQDAARKKIEESKNGLEITARKPRTVIENLGEVINTKTAEYGPVISTDESVLIFTSRREGTIGGKKDPDMNEYYEDLYISYNEGGRWTSPQNMKEPVNDDGHDASVSLSPDGQRLLIYRLGDIYECDLKGDKWTRPKKLGKNINDPNYHESSASLSFDGQWLFFVSQRPGGFGGRDIYKSKWNTKKERWEKAENIGPAINTAYDEESVFIHPDGKTLYFSSKGHNTMGGHDIFMTVHEKGKWEKPINLGAPVNSPDDDLFFVLSASGEHGYYSSFKTNGFGEKDIYKVTFITDEPEEAKKNITVLQGFFLDRQTLNPISATLEIFDIEEGVLVGMIQSDPETGEYYIELPSGKKYGFTVTAKGHLLHYENFSSEPEGQFLRIEKTIELDQLPPDEIDALSAKYADNPTFRFMGFLLDDQTLKPLQATIQIINLDDGSVFITTTTNAKGEYSIKLPRDKHFAYRILSKGHLLQAANLPLPEDSEVIINRDINLKPLAYMEQPELKTMHTSDKKLTVLKGFFREAETLAPIEATIEIFDLEDGTLIGTFTSNSKTGKYLITLPSGKNYGITVKADGHLFHSENFNIPASGGFKEISKDVILEKIKTGSKIVLNNVFFGYGKYSLRKESEMELEKVQAMLIDNPNIKVEISGHTDDISSAAYNQRLSEQRAKTVVSQLVAKGIPKERLIYKGYGESKPIASNDTETGRQRNRRTEFKIISE